MFQESLRSDPVMPTMRKTLAMISGGKEIKMPSSLISREI